MVTEQDSIVIINCSRRFYNEEKNITGFDSVLPDYSGYGSWIDYPVDQEICTVKRKNGWGRIFSDYR